MEEEFYAVVKLVSGEEIICKICYMPEEDTCLVSEPMKVEYVTRSQNLQGMQGFTLVEWLHSTFEDLFLIPRSNILTMSECDKKVENFYLKCLSEDKKQKLNIDEIVEGFTIISLDSAFEKTKKDQSKKKEVFTNRIS